jgi:putative DNA primase/helicase
VNLLCAADIAPEAVSWLWDGWLARGKVYILAGAPSTGKTTIALDAAATITCGGRWPDGSRAEAGSVVIWSGEDTVADVLVPRLIASGADMSRVRMVGDVGEAGERRPFNASRDMPALWRAIDSMGDVRLLIIDPIVSAIAGDSHKNAEVRRGLQPLADLAGLNSPAKAVARNWLLWPPAACDPTAQSPIFPNAAI